MSEIEILRTETFDNWIRSLKDKRAKRIIATRIDRLHFGLLGDVKTLDGQISELRIHYGPGYRVYFTRRGRTVVILLCGGTKRRQNRDIQKAMELAKLIGK